VADRTRRGAPPGEPRLVGYLYVLPAMLVFGAFLLWPILRTVSLSFYEWDGLTQGTWVGLENYRAVLTEPALRAPFVHALVLVLFFCVLPIVAGLALAGLMSRATLPGLGFFRTVIFLPQVVATVVVGIAWSELARRAPAAGPAPSSPSAAPVSPTSATGRPSVEARVSGPGGLTVRYLDENGQIQQLDVKDFGR